MCAGIHIKPQHQTIIYSKGIIEGKLLNCAMKAFPMFVFKGITSGSVVKCQGDHYEKLSNN